MAEFTRPAEACGRLKTVLAASAEYFRKGLDHDGLDSLLEGLEDFRGLLGANGDFIPPPAGLEKFRQVLRRIHTCMKNQDVAGLTDELELSLLPLAEEWCGG